MTRDNLEKNKFSYSLGEIRVKLEEWEIPYSSINDNTPIDDLETKKFTSSWNIRIKSTF